MPETKAATAPTATASGSELLSQFPGFELLREKGRGPHATVFKARRLSDKLVVALKIYHAGACDRATVARLNEGIKATAKLQHPGAVRALEFKTEAGRSALVLEYATGEALSNFLYRQQKLPASKAIAVMLHGVRTLASVAPQGFHHGRLYPGAVILSRNNVRITGVGMGERPQHAPWSVQYPDLFDPLMYTAPEAMPSKPFPTTNLEAVDIYSLGAMLFHLLTGQAPQEGNDEGSILAERKRYRTPLERFPALLSPELRGVLANMLAADPGERPWHASGARESACRAGSACPAYAAGCRAGRGRGARR